MFISDCVGLNERNHLTIGGCDAITLAEEFGTPLYVMDENQVRENCRRFVSSMKKHYGENGMVAFASKAFSCKHIYRVLESEGMGADVVSAGEIYTALSAGFPSEKLVFHGNNKTPEELAFAVQNKIGRIAVDNMFELEMLEGIAKSADAKVKIQLRIKPGVEAHTHDFVKTGGIDSKFGFALETGEAMAAVRKAESLPHIDLAGINCHIGSQIFDIEPFEHTAGIMLEFMAEIKTELGLELTELNLGGGFGIRYIQEQNPTAFENYMEAVSRKIKATCKQLGLTMPMIIIEPGRSIVGSAGVTLYRVGAVKEIPNIRTYVTVDGSMADNPRYALYHAEYDMVVANKANLPKSKVYTVTGRCCESDLLGEGVKMQEAEIGDILAVLATGAYNYSMSSNYNRLPKPAVVFIKDGKAEIKVKRETLEDIIRNDL